MNKINILIISILLLLLTGCNEVTATDQNLPKQIVENPYATKQILVLSKLNTYKAQLIERLTKRLGKTYSFTIDDLSTIYTYNFSHYKSVVLIETPAENNMTTLDPYFKDFSGITNFTILAVTDKPYKPSANFEILVIKPNTENITETAEIIIDKIRTQR